MKKDTNQLTEWVINKIKTEYADDVALLVAVEGGSINGDGHGEPFDYFIPATERGNELAQTFIIGSIGNDLYPRSWERTERTANLEDPATPCLGSAKILYARSKEDEAHFEAIRQKLFDNLNNPDFIYRKALENLDIAMNLYKTMMFEEQLYRVRGLAGYIHYYLTISVACLNRTYRRDWHNGVIGEISKWKELPESFVEYYQGILTAHTVSELRNLSYLLIASARQFIARHKPQKSVSEKKPDYHWLAEWYQELKTWWNRLYFFCSDNDSDAAFREACQLQGELDMVGDEFMLGEMDLLGCFNSQDLEPLSRRAAKLEEVIISTIEKEGVKIRRYDTLDAFLSAGEQNTPKKG